MPEVSWLFFKARAKHPYLSHTGRASNAEKQPTGPGPEGCDENGPSAALLVGHVSIKISSLLAPCRRPILIATPLYQSLTWCTRSFKFGARRPLLAVEIHSRRPLGSRDRNAKDVRAGQSFHAVDRTSTDFDSVPVHIGDAICPADDDGHGPFRRLFGRPFEFSGRRAGFGREQKTWLDRFFRSGIMVSNNDCCSDGRDRLKISCKIHRQPHTRRNRWPES